MIRAVGVSGRDLKSFARQLLVSVSATLVATTLYAGLQAGLHGFGPAASSLAPPEMTSGGKFAARAVAAPSGTTDVVAALQAPPYMPLLAAVPAAAPAPQPMSKPDSPVVADALARLKPVSETPHPQRRVASNESRRRLEIAHVLPPKRADLIPSAVVEAAAPAALAAETDLTFGVWPATKNVLKQAANLGSAALNRVLP